MSQQIWTLTKNGIEWKADHDHSDDIEMSGLYADQIVYYGVKDWELCLSQKC